MKRASTRRFVRYSALAGGLLALLLTAAACAASLPQRRALLIGVSRYDAFCPSHTQCTRNDLEGPPYDVAAMRAVLEQRFGYTPAQVTVLEEANAVKPAVLAALRDLAAWAAPGREIFIYFSGHGTGPLDQGERLNLPDDTAALVLAPPGPVPPGVSPVTFLAQRMLLVGREDVRPLLTAMDRKGASVIAVLDACFSQNAFRSASVHRDRRFRSADLDEVFPPVDTHGLKSRQASPWPYHHVAWISAASANETALDLTAADLDRWPTVDGKPHGALTDALLRVLEGQEWDGKGELTYAELFAAAEDYMRRMKLPQSPQVSPSPLFGDPQALAVMKEPAFGETRDETDDEGKERAAAARITVSLPATARELRGQLALIPGLALSDERDAEYRIEESPDGLDLLTGRGEPVLAAGSDSVPQAESRVIESLRLRAAMRRLASQARARSRGLQIIAGSADPSVSGTLLPGHPFSLMLRASRDVTIVLVDLMGDGSTRVWIPSIAGETPCRHSPHVRAHVPTLLCAWPGSAPPYGLDLIYILAAEGRSAELAGIRDRELDPSVLEVLEQVVAHHPGRVAMRELPLYTLGRVGS